jgi:hypothetical protein
MPDLTIPANLDFMAVVDVTGLASEAGGVGDVTGFADAIESARDRGLSCYLVDDGIPVAAIVPVARRAAAGVTRD